MIGIVLCGGQSIRMGSDKGLLKTGDANWALTATEKLSALGLNVKASISLTQLTVYSDLLPNVELITDNTAIPVKGPLLGILSAHIANPTEDIFAFACDIPQMETFLLKELYDQSLKHQADAFIFTNDGEAEPLCAIYSASGLQHIVTMMKQGELKKFSMKFILDHLTLFTIPIEEHNKKYFQNFNAHADLNGL